MSKGKPRHNPDKLQNKYGDFCESYDGYTCHCGRVEDISKCKANRHNCIKSFYARLASRSDIQKQNGNYRRRSKSK